MHGTSGSGADKSAMCETKVGAARLGPSLPSVLPKIGESQVQEPCGGGEAARMCLENTLKMKGKEEEGEEEEDVCCIISMPTFPPGWRWSLRGKRTSTYRLNTYSAVTAEDRAAVTVDT